MTMPTIVCVLRSGGEFLPEHVYALRDGVYVYLHKAHRFVCLSDSIVPGVEVILLDYSYPGWWAKLCLFAPPNNSLGHILYFDLDTVIVGDLGDIVQVSCLTMLADFYRPERLASGMMYLPRDVREEVWERWQANTAGHMRRFRGDQEFLGPSWAERAERWQDLLPGQVISYKAHVQRNRQALEAARVVCFHGRPRPWQLPQGALGNG